jgi:SpoVK/Ycf46/Vps4 family AAA+-type ATPase
VDWLVKKMAGLSGSDIKEQCRSAAIGPLNEQIEKMEKAGLPLTTLDPSQVRGLSMDDFPYGRRPKKAASQGKSSVVTEEEAWQTESEAEGASEADGRFSEMVEPPE